MTKHFKSLLSALVLAAVSLTALPNTAAAAGLVAVESQVASRIVQITTKVTVRNVTRDAARNLVIVVPPSVMSKAGTQKVLAVSFATEPTSTRETPAGIEATYKVAEVPGGATLTFEQTYTVELAQGAELVTEEQIDARYLNAEAGIESDNEAIKSRALAATAGLTTTTAKVEALIKTVGQILTYDLNATARNKGALAGFQTGAGVCSEYAGLFVAMARANGIPARLVYGWAQTSTLEGALNSSSRHVWAEYYDEKRGWVAVDPTFAEVQSDVLAFDALNHVAQDFTNTTFSASFGGRGLLSVVGSQTLTQVQVVGQR